MVTLFIVSVAFSVIVSGCCSLMEAALYAVPFPFVKSKATEGKRHYKWLLEFKENVGRPIAGILILNTTANTAGASVAGYAAAEAFGEAFIVPFSVAFTLAILYLSEIIPKQIGVVYCKQVAPVIAVPLRVIVTLVSPLIWFSEQMSRFIKTDDSPSYSLEEIVSVAEIGQEEGALDHFEGSVITNVIGLDERLVKDVLTPRVVVFRMPGTTLVDEVKSELPGWNYTRVPLFSEEQPEMLTHYVTQRDVFRALLAPDTEKKTLQDLARPLATIPELVRVDKALLTMFENHEQMCAVVDEHGGLAGIITLEDIIEEIIGREIVDEYDTVSDMRTFAKLMQITRHRRRTPVRNRKVSAKGSRKKPE